jgi:uncharacterized membrane protein
MPSTFWWSASRAVTRQGDTMLWLTPFLVLAGGTIVIVLFLCVAAVTQTPKKNRGDRAEEILREILMTIRKQPRHRR